MKKTKTKTKTNIRHHHFYCELHRAVHSQRYKNSKKAKRKKAFL